MKFYIDTEKKEIQFFDNMKLEDMIAFFNGWGNELKNYKIVFNNTLYSYNGLPYMLYPNTSNPNPPYFTTNSSFVP